jgi:hypothetical protein
MPYSAACFPRFSASLMLLAVGWALLGAGCAPEQPKAANPVRPVDEARAVRIIANALRDAGVAPEPQRMVQLAPGRNVELDVCVQGRQWGIAYVTQEERKSVDEDVPANLAADSLLVLRGRGPDSDARILVLLASNYMSDDTVGDEREATTVAAEHRIARDVRDFVVQAKSDKWP